MIADPKSFQALWVTLSRVINLSSSSGVGLAGDATLVKRSATVTALQMLRHIMAQSTTSGWVVAQQNHIPAPKIADP